MTRDDVVIVAASGDSGKSRPAVSLQSDALPHSHGSVVVCQLASEIVEAPNFRVTVDPSRENGLRVRSQIMADKPVTVRRVRIGQSIGRLSPGEIAHLNVALAFVMGLAD